MSPAFLIYVEYFLALVVFGEGSPQATALETQYANDWQYMAGFQKIVLLYCQLAGLFGQGAMKALVGALPSDREGLRRMILAGDDAIMNSLVWRFMSADQQHLFLATRACFAADEPVTNAFMDKILTQLATQRRG